MKKRVDQGEGLTFTKTQVYLILGCIMAIAVLSFSLGHLVSRDKDVKTPAEAKPHTISEAEVLNELNTLERQLRGAPAPTTVTSPAKSEDIPEETPAVKVKVVSEDEPKPSSVEATPIPVVVEPVEVAVEDKSPPPSPAVPDEKPKIKSLSPRAERVSLTPVDKNVSVAANKPPASFSRSKPTSQPPATKSQPPKADIIQAEKVSAAPVPPETPVEVVSEPAPKPTTKEKIADSRPLAREKNFSVQAASYINRTDAEEMAARLRSKGYESFVIKYERAKSVWYRVRVGGYATRADAQKVANAIRYEERLEPTVENYENPR